MTKTQSPPKRLIAKRRIIRSPQSTWIAFLTSTRTQPEYAKLNFGDLCKAMSIIWRGMDKAQKAPFVETYLKDKQRYKADLLNLTDADKKILRAHKRRRRAAAVGRPKAALSTYMMFVKKERSNVVLENDGITFREIGSELGKRWRELSVENKQEFVLTAAIDRVRFETELIAWKGGIIAVPK
jgi:hypothetical protein